MHHVNDVIHAFMRLARFPSQKSAEWSVGENFTMVSINGIFADSLWETESKYKYKKHFLWTLKKVSLAIFDSLNSTGTCTFTMDL